MAYLLPNKAKHCVLIYEVNTSLIGHFFHSFPPKSIYFYSLYNDLSMCVANNSVCARVCEIRNESEVRRGDGQLDSPH